MRHPPLPPLLAVTALLLTTQVASGAYPLTAFDHTGIRRLHAFLNAEAFGARPIPNGARMPLDYVRLRMAGEGRDFDITDDTPRDPQLQPGPAAAQAQNGLRSLAPPPRQAAPAVHLSWLVSGPLLGMRPCRAAMIELRHLPPLLARQGRTAPGTSRHLEFLSGANPNQDKVHSLGVESKSHRESRDIHAPLPGERAETRNRLPRL